MTVDDRLLVLGTYGGLGNRVKPVLSGARYAETTGRRFVYRWTRDRLFRALPTDLWTDFPQAAGPIEFARARLGAAEIDDPIRIEEVASADRILVRHHDPIGPSDLWHEDLRALHPVQQVEERTRAVLAPLAAKPVRIGVMVRAHRRASDVTKETSPPVWFAERLERAVGALGDSAAVYLSCDNPAVQAGLVQRFPDLIRTEKHGYNSRIGVQDALVDLYGLGACDVILGPDGSTFVHLADYLGGGQAQVVTPNIGDFEHQLERLRGVELTSRDYPWMAG